MAIQYIIEHFLLGGDGEVFLTPMPIHEDATDPDGYFALALPMGTYDVFVTPPADSPSAAAPQGLAHHATPRPQDALC